MVTQDAIDSTIVKAKYVSDIRKTEIRHTQDLNFNDLVLMMQRFFQIKPNANVSLKYRDSENDWITLANDDDVSFALRHENNLYIEVFVNEENVAHPTLPITSDSVLIPRNSEKYDDDEQKSVASQRQKPAQNQQPSAKHISTNEANDVSPQQLNSQTHIAPAKTPLQSNNAPQLQQLFSATPPLQQQFYPQQQPKPLPESNNQQQTLPPTEPPFVQSQPSQQQYPLNTPPNIQPPPQQPQLYSATPTFPPQQSQQSQVQKTTIESFPQQPPTPLQPAQSMQPCEPPHSQSLYSTAQPPFSFQHQTAGQLQATPNHPPAHFPIYQPQSFPPSSMSGFASLPPSSIGTPISYPYQLAGNGCAPPPSLAGGQSGITKPNAGNPFARGPQVSGRPAGGYFQ